MKLSMNQKVALLQIPLMGVGFCIAMFAWQTGQKLQSHSEVQTISQLALKSSIYVAEMGSALKGYLLDPTNEGEAKKKKEADDNNAEAIKKMQTLTKDPELLGLITLLGDLDEKQLNPVEDEVLELVKKKNIKEAQSVFVEKYLPLRSKYDDMSKKIQVTSEERSAAATREFEENVHSAIVKIITLVVGGILGFALVLALTLTRITTALSGLKTRLSGVTDSFNKASNGISEVSQRLADSATESAAAIQESVSSITEMSAMLTQTSRNAVATAELSKDVQQQTESGVGVMEAMSDSMKNISASSARLKEIVQVIDNISEKTNVINDVVFKTQLLAVNASIEAARAGHHGKGFAVVANEVASLAALSGKAAAEIRELLRSSATKVDEIINHIASSIDDGEEVSEKSANAFKQIAKAITSISDKIEQISVASREQEAGIRQTSAALAEMNQTTATTNEVAQKNAILGRTVAKQAAALETIDHAMTVVVLGAKTGVPMTSTTFKRPDAGSQRAHTHGNDADEFDATTDKVEMRSHGSLSAFATQVRLRSKNGQAPVDAASMDGDDANDTRKSA